MKQLYYKALISAIITFLVCNSYLAYSGNANKENLLYPTLVNQFYTVTHQHLFWMNNSGSSGEMRNTLLQKIENSAYVGTGKSRYKYDQLLNATSTQSGDSSVLLNADMLFTDAAIAYCKDLYQGYGIESWIKYDEWSRKYSEKDNDFIIGHLIAARSSAELLTFLDLLEPNTKEYVAYKEEFKAQYLLNNIAKAQQVAISMNFYRWLHHFNFEKLIVVNVASATLNYYENNTEILFSKMIVGKPSRRTPRFDATCSQVILYPYWNVPADIAQKELVPKYKKSPGLVEKENMQILDAKGNILNAYAINWAQYGSKYFPFRLRQSTGCDNSLGIIKLDLTSPFGVYLHDTNQKELFKSNNRYRSHGCMRIEKAIELGNYILNNKLDTAFLQACIKGEKPITLQLEKPVPVFVVYLTAEVTERGTIGYYHDVYHLLHAN